jgi:hypothetical protein
MYYQATINSPAAGNSQKVNGNVICAKFAAMVHFLFFVEVNNLTLSRSMLIICTKRPLCIEDSGILHMAKFNPFVIIVNVNREIFIIIHTLQRHTIKYYGRFKSSIMQHMWYQGNF